MCGRVEHSNVKGNSLNVVHKFNSYEPLISVGINGGDHFFPSWPHLLS
jgi:hypothetical protein